MKVALIHCPLGHRPFSENLKVVDEEFCLAPPIVLAYVASILERAGHKVILIDANALGFTKEKTAVLLKIFRPDVIGFRADTYWFHRVVEWAGYLKKRFPAKIIAGGINVTLYPKESLSYPCFDYGVCGEAVESLPKLLRAIESGNAPSHISGIVYREGHEIVLNAPVEKAADFDSYPFPARHLLPNHAYHSFTSQLRNFTIMLTSTGCPFKCRFCAISSLAYRQRSYSSVVDEIEECSKRFAVREIDFFDAAFFIDQARAIRICEEILKRGIRVEWSCRSRVDAVNSPLLKIASRAGCRKIYYGIESASDAVLKSINKCIDSQQAADAINLTRKHGIKTMGFFMVGNPSDTKESIASSIRFAKTLRLDFIQVCRTIAKPSTQLHDQLNKACGIDYWREYILGNRPAKRLPTPWTDLPEFAVEKYMRKFYRDFYFRPGYIIGVITRIRSFGELLRYMKVALKWFFVNYSDINRRFAGTAPPFRATLRYVEKSQKKGEFAA